MFQLGRRWWARGIDEETTSPTILSSDPNFHTSMADTIFNAHPSLISSGTHGDDD